MATPTYSELWALAATGTFTDRCTVAVAKYAQYILSENPATTNHQRRYNWATGAILNPRNVATQLGPAIAIDSVFTTQDPLNLSSTPDSGAGSIQVAVEATINSTVLTF